MASDPARQYIEDVEARYAVLFPTTPPPFKVGGLTLNENDSPPVVKWRFGTCKHDPSEDVESIATERQELIIRVWGTGQNADETDANTRQIKNRLLLACRQTAQSLNSIPESLQIGDFDWSDEQHNVHGRHLEGTIEVRLNVPDEQYQTAVIAQAQVTEHADYDGDGTNDEVIHTSNDFPDP